MWWTSYSVGGSCDGLAMGEVTIGIGNCFDEGILREVTLSIDGIVLAKLRSSRVPWLAPTAVGPYSLQWGYVRCTIHLHERVPWSPQRQLTPHNRIII